MGNDVCGGCAHARNEGDRLLCFRNPPVPVFVGFVNGPLLHGLAYPQPQTMNLRPTVAPQTPACGEWLLKKETT